MKVVRQRFYFVAFFAVEFTIITNAADSDHFFCGSTWGDASNNCEDRQHCPGGTDDECSTEGHICFGGTSCNSKLGHGNKFTYADVDYNDISNTRFCGTGWNAAVQGCSIQTHCPSGFSDECPTGQSCYGGLDCNVQDFYAEEAEKDAQTPVGINNIGKDDERRNMFCGTNWADANKQCMVWCPSGQDEDCPGDTGCFGSTECYSYGDLIPTSTPVIRPTIPPSTMPPVSYNDPKNNRFCGHGWGSAQQNCSFETHCPSGSSDECPKGQTCHGGLPSPQCNIVDIYEKLKNYGKPTARPQKLDLSKDDVRNTKFCGNSWDMAESNCSLDTHCPNDNCPAGQVCYGGTKCNAFEMTLEPTKSPSMKPTQNPTIMPVPPTGSPTLPVPPSPPPTAAPVFTTQSPTQYQIPADDIRHSYWCGKDWKDVTKNCFEPCISGQDTECSDPTMKCIAFTTCRPSPKPTKPPTKEPTIPTTPQPSLQLTEKPTVTTISETSVPSRKPILEQQTREPTNAAINEGSSNEFSTLSPSNRPSSKPTTLKPTTKPTTSPTAKKFIPVELDQAPPPSLIAKIGSILVTVSDDINEKILLTMDSTGKEMVPTQRYLFGGFVNSLGIVSKGHLGSSYFYLGQNDDPSAAPDYGLVNVALLISQAAVETVKYDMCDEVSWEKDIFGRYPLANSCGQGKFSKIADSSYEDTNQCSNDESFMACSVDSAMMASAETKKTWDGAPPPLECYPSTNNEGTGAWDSNLSCKAEGCNSYEGQVKGAVDPNSVPSSNSFGFNNVEGCCWWGRGAFPRGSSGTCLIGKLNYYLGKRASLDGRSSVRYGELDFCKDPSSICRGFYKNKEKNAEIRWMMGIMYWIRNVQTYNRDGFSFMEQLHKFVESGLREPADFFDDVTRIVTRGCHLKSCGNAVSVEERRRIFDNIIEFFADAQAGPTFSKQTPPPTNKPSTREPVSTSRPTTRPTSPKATSRPLSSPTTPPTLLSTTPKADSTLHPTVSSSSTTAKPSEFVVSDEVTSLTMDELQHRMNFPNNYCATSLEEAESKCATSLRTCNFGDPLCPIGHACLGNIICFAAAHLIVQTEERSSYSCGDNCLRPLTSQECASGGNMGAFESLPNCLDVRIGELCVSQGECGATLNNIDNCPGGLDIFMRVDKKCPTNHSVAATGNETVIPIQNQSSSTLTIDDTSIATIPSDSSESQGSPAKSSNSSLIN
ncbi:hypothetical protein ACHAWC_003762, partial [Mediolabrus comicus]